ncbi:hypothetical protein [Arthrobacter sp. RIT-PI-e]|uniref:hypothetical protein n=1 Tax=Arthrobacter sp. RIT-PI-e TaxID=1681197 RepID=UPI001364A01B|nr:hypothetical protein [Arthrobacter sp. RIT-PI-e]
MVEEAVVEGTVEESAGDPAATFTAGFSARGRGRAAVMGRASGCAGTSGRSMRSFLSTGRNGARTVAASIRIAPSRHRNGPMWNTMTVCRKKNVVARTAETEANWSTESEPTRRPAAPRRRPASRASAATGTRIPMPMKKRDVLFQKLL